MCYAPPMFRPLDLLYLTALVLASPWLAWRYFVRGKDRGGWFAKLTGRVQARFGEEPCVWLHAVSVGEALQLPGLIAAVAARRPDAVFAVTVSTDTGLAVAREKLADRPGVRVDRAPLDFSWAMRRYLRRVRPEACVLVELELWPNLVRRCCAAGVRVLVANGRLGGSSFRGYRRLGPLVRPTFRRLAWVGAQTDEYAARFVALGTPADRVTTTGSVKFDAVTTDPRDPRVTALRDAFGLRPDDPVLLAGSTGDPEEATALDAYETLHKTHPALRLLIAPRGAVRGGGGTGAGPRVRSRPQKRGERGASAP